MHRKVTISLYSLLVFVIKHVICSEYVMYDYLNITDPARLQLFEFKKEHPKPIGILTTSSGKLVEIRETLALNSNPFKNLYHVDTLTHTNAERIPERFVHAKGTGAFGYFEVTNDISQYTKADVFNGVGKRTPLVARFSSALQSRGGNDLERDLKGFALKFYTNEGNLDLLCISFPVYFYRDANDFPNFVHSFRKNPKNDLTDYTSRLDFLTKRPDILHAFLWLESDFGIPNGYRKMDSFAVHAFEINNKHGDRYFAKFNLRTEQGVENLSSEQAAAVTARELDYYNRDLYNAIESKKYPAWRLEMDVISYDEVRKLNYNPFQVNVMWKRGTYHTVTIGRVVLNRNPDNYFAVAEQSAFSPGRLVPGIPGPIDTMFHTRRQAYRDTQIYRLSVNHNKIRVNAPLYSKNYLKDGKPPVGDNGRDAPSYYPNSFSGPIPFVDTSYPKEKFSVLESNAVDIQPASQFYNEILDCQQRDRLVNNSVAMLETVAAPLQRRVIRLFNLVDSDLSRRVTRQLKKAMKAPKPQPPEVLKPPKTNYYLRNTVRCK